MAAGIESSRNSRNGLSPGYSLIEIIFVLGLILIVLAITAPGLKRSSVDRTNARAAAMQLTEDLRYLRQRAITSMIPTGLVIPNRKLEFGHCRGYLMKEGLVGTATTKVVDFQKQYDRASLFVGVWDIDPSKLHNPAAQNSGASITKYANNLSFDAGTWGGGSTDYIFLFGPGGSVITNGNMPHFDNSYHIVVGEYYSYVPESSPGTTSGPGVLTSWFKLTDVWRPIYTVTLTPAGEVSFSEGVEALSQSAYQASGEHDPGQGAPLASSINGPPPNYPPQISGITLLPKINRLVYPEATGIDATVRIDGTLNIVVTAKDPTGNLLYLKPGAAPGPGAPNPQAGTFSVPVDQFFKMSYDPTSDTYSGTLDWTPPPPPAGINGIGAQYVLSFAVSNLQKQTEEKRRVLTIRQDKLLFVSNRENLTGPSAIYIMNTDGSGSFMIPYKPMSDAYPSWFPDFKKIVFSGPRDQPTSQIWSIDTDCGKDLQQLTLASGSNTSPSLSVDGTKIAFTSAGPGGEDIYVMWSDGKTRMDAHGDTQINVTNTGGQNRDPDWFKSPGEMKLTYASNVSGNFQIHMVERRQMEGRQGTYYKFFITRLTNNSDNDQHPVWSPDGTKIAFDRSTGGGNSEIYVMNADGTGQSRLTDTPNFSNTYPSWSPDNRLLVFQSNRDENNEIYIMNADGSGQKNLTNSPQSDDRMPSWIK